MAVVGSRLVIPGIDHGKSGRAKWLFVARGDAESVDGGDTRDLTICDRDRESLAARAGDYLCIGLGGRDVEWDDAIAKQVCDLLLQRARERGSPSSDRQVLDPQQQFGEADRREI